MSTMMTPETTEQEIKVIKAGIKYLQNNRGVLLDRMNKFDPEKDAQLLKEYEDVLQRLEYAVHGLKRMLADANNARRAEKVSVIGAARHHKSMWDRERKALQTRISEQRQQLHWLLENNKALRESTQEMLKDRMRLIAENAALREECITLHHSFGDEPLCAGCPKEDCIVRPVLEEGKEQGGE